jgi:hypothetical protein
MLEDAYPRLLNTLLESCECDVAVPTQWHECLIRRGGSAPAHGDRRKSVRHEFHVRAVLEYNQSLPAIPREHTVTQVVARDLSGGGISFLHADQLFPGEHVSLWLLTGKRSYEVVRCVLHNENSREVSRCDSPILLTT